MITIKSSSTKIMSSDIGGKWLETVLCYTNIRGVALGTEINCDY